jgi:hypothetical protein
MSMDHVAHFNEVTVAISEGEEHQHHDHQDPADETFKIWVSVLIGISAIGIALIVWGSGIMGNHSGAEDADGIGAAVKDQQADVSSKAGALEDHVGYLAYRRNNLTGDLIYDYLNTGSAPKSGTTQYDQLKRQMLESWDVGIGIDDFFTTRWSKIEIGDGKLVESYEADRQYRASLADARQRNDLNSKEHLKKAEDGRHKALELIISMPIFGAVIWLLTLAYDADRRVRLFPTFVACALFVFGAVWAVYIYWLR